MPLAVQGQLVIDAGQGERAIGIERVHLEEDVAKLHHHPSEYGESYSLVDVNRSGVPLMEVVSKPDLRSPEEAREYLTILHSILQYLDVSTGNMQDGSFRCDANISLRPKGSPKLGSKAEVKNMNSFRSVYLALKYEEERQRKVLEQGGRVAQETRGWVEERNVTVSQRSKEHAHDYRYFPEPDLPPLTIHQSWVEELKERLPELAPERKARFIGEYGLPEYDAGLLTESKTMADYYEAAAALAGGSGQALAKNISNWMLGDLTRLLNLDNASITETMVTPGHLVELISLVDRGAINGNTAKAVLEEVFNTGKSPAAVVEEKGYAQISDTSAVEAAVTEAIETNPKAVEDFRNGKENASKFLVGQVMRLTKGQAKPDLVNQLVEDRLRELR